LDFTGLNLFVAVLRIRSRTYYTVLDLQVSEILYGHSTLYASYLSVGLCYNLCPAVCSPTYTLSFPPVIKDRRPMWLLVSRQTV